MKKRLLVLSLIGILSLTGCDVFSNESHQNISESSSQSEPHNSEIDSQTSEPDDP